MRQVSQRAVKVDIFVHVIADEQAQVKYSAQANHGVEQVGMAKEKVAGVISAHAATGCNDFLRAVGAMLTDKGRDFLGDVTVIVFVAAGAVGGVGFPVGPGLAVDSVDGENLDFSVFDEPRDCVNHAVVFIVVKTFGLGRKDQHGFAVPAINFEFHFVAEIGAVPAVVFASHSYFS